VRLGRIAGAAAIVSATACSLLVDTTGFSSGRGGVTPVTPDAADARAGDSAGPDAAPDGGDSGASGDGGSSGAVYAQTILADAPVAYWRMGATSGTTVKDEIGDLDLELHGGFELGVPGAVEGDADTAVAFDGTLGTYGATIATSAFDFTGTHPFTIECWASLVPTDGSSEYQHLVGSSEGQGGGRQGFILYFVPDDDTASFEWDSTDDYHAPAKLPSASSALHHYAGVFDGTAVVLYVDGVAGAAPLAVTGALAARGDALFVGADHDSDSVLSGVIDEVAVYDRALAPSDLVRHVAAAHGKP
jgi:hypothetical protein